MKLFAAKLRIGSIAFAILAVLALSAPNAHAQSLATGGGSAMITSGTTLTVPAPFAWAATNSPPLNTYFSVENLVVDSNGNLEKVTSGNECNSNTCGKSGTSQPSWPTGPTGTTTTDNGVTWTLEQIPAGSTNKIQSGDLLIALVGATDSTPGSISAPTGCGTWANLYDKTASNSSYNAHGTVWWKIAGSCDNGSPYSFTVPSGGAYGRIADFKNVDQGNPIDTSSSQTGAGPASCPTPASTTMTGSTATPSFPADLSLAFYFTRPVNTQFTSQPTGYSLGFVDHASSYGGGDLASKLLSSTTATGSLNSTIDTCLNPWVAFQVLLNATDTTASVSPSSCDEGSVASGGSPPNELDNCTFTVNNSGFTDHLYVSNITFTDSDFMMGSPSMYSFTDCQAPGGTPAQSACSITPAFIPAGTGPHSTTMEIYDNTASSPQSVTITGNTCYVAGDGTCATGSTTGYATHSCLLSVTGSCKTVGSGCFCQ